MIIEEWYDEFKKKILFEYDLKKMMKFLNIKIYLYYNIYLMIIYLK